MGTMEDVWKSDVRETLTMLAYLPDEVRAKREQEKPNEIQL